MEKQTYSREDFEVFINGFPERGLFCEKCKAFIPVFEELTDTNIADLLRIIETNPVVAIGEIVRLTGCSQRFAKIWVIHRGKPHSKNQTEKFPCPYCQKPLRTKESRQCRNCLQDWHNNNS